MQGLRGVDGCRAGWLAVSCEGPGEPVTARLFPSALELLEGPGWHLTAIDIPIGLPEAGPRRCDREARRLLGPRRSSVFSAPLRGVLAATSYPEACALSQAAQGCKLSKQAFHILAKVRQVDAWLQRDPGQARCLVEVHPELCFREWNGGVPMPHPKRSAAGAADRLALVERIFPGAAAAIRARFLRRQVADDDILDALAALWSAARIEAGTALRLGGDLDGTGLPMQILV
ncbi:DUF429 domain-containing protein [Synechococcus sp. CCY9202]|uniref:DUF429 domain-containing protein n=1 Tax=Synechococcus sp. CCY9202 TaxID=174698 RepID=UPI002B21F5D1|nr:DUF429 domain-containing protein [Synechococcus sp. CCY9202]MEA5424558.1 DUF429 domain-containing protein [Synechococcus sp. CCY9202]